ncbi:MAG: hypothetical protein IK077_15575 [Thermoguttaceae bacterium]|nr:hypothetical protein [Thermoguttaceae bacterium]
MKKFDKEEISATLSNALRSAEITGDNIIDLMELVEKEIPAEGACLEKDDLGFVSSITNAFTHLQVTLNTLQSAYEDYFEESDKSE